MNQYWKWSLVAALKPLEGEINYIYMPNTVVQQQVQQQK